MDFRKIALSVLALLLAGLIWSRWWLQPERQVRRAQGRLLSAIEKGRFDAMANLLAEDYRDRWQHDKAIVLGESREVFGQFLTLTVERADFGIEAKGDRWLLREKLTLKGLGGPLAIAVRDEVNALREPFAMAWRLRSWKPWDWELVSVEQPALELPR